MKKPDTPSDHSVDFRHLLEGGGQPIFESTADIFDQKKLEQAVAKAVREITQKIDDAFLAKLPADINSILFRIATDQQADIHQVAAEWLVQQGLFIEIVKHFGLASVGEFSSNSLDGFMALTMNGSLLTGTTPATGLLRDINYTRIPSRKESWKGAVAGKMAISDLDIGQRATFSGRRFDADRNPTGFTTSPLRQICVIPSGRMKEFECITRLTRDSMTFTVR